MIYMKTNFKLNVPNGQSRETATGHVLVNVASVLFTSVNGYVRERPHVFSSKISI